MDTLTVIAGLCISTAVLVYLAHTDPKRRRVFGRPPHEERRHVWSSLFILSVPGIWLLMSGNGAGFTIWLGGLTVVGWGVAATNPARAEALRDAAPERGADACGHEEEDEEGAGHGGQRQPPRPSAGATRLCCASELHQAARLVRQ